MIGPGWGSCTWQGNMGWTVLVRGWESLGQSVKGFSWGCSIGCLCCLRRPQPRESHNQIMALVNSLPLPPLSWRALQRTCARTSIWASGNTRIFILYHIMLLQVARGSPSCGWRELLSTHHLCTLSWSQRQLEEHQSYGHRELHTTHFPLWNFYVSNLLTNIQGKTELTLWKR